MSPNSETSGHEAEKVESGTPQNTALIEEKNISEKSDKDSNENKLADNSFNNMLSASNMTHIRGSDNQLRCVQGQVSLVPNLTFNFNQFITNILNFSGGNPDITDADFIDKIIEVWLAWQEAQCVLAIKPK